MNRFFFLLLYTGISSPPPNHTETTNMLNYLVGREWVGYLEIIHTTKHKQCGNHVQVNMHIPLQEKKLQLFCLNKQSTKFYVYFSISIRIINPNYETTIEDSLFRPRNIVFSSRFCQMPILHGIGPP